MKVRLPLSLLFACAVSSVAAVPAPAAESSFSFVIDPTRPTTVFSDKLLSKQWQWYLSKNGVNIVPVWQQGITGSGVVIGIMDSWVEPNHEDLNVSPYNPTNDAYNGQGLSKDFVGSEVVPTDNPETEEDESQTQIYTEENHGQFVAGMAAAIGGNEVGIVGAAPGATIAGLHISLTSDQEISDASYWGSGVSVDAATGAISYMNDAAIQVKNCSFGSVYDQKGDEYFWKAISDTSANNVIYVFAAGNSRGEDSTNWPGTTAWDSSGSCPDIINVAATNKDGRYTSFSCFGSNVFVSAPGEQVVSTDRTGEIGYNAGGLTSSSDSDSDDSSSVAETSIANANYAASDGTSFSAPLVSGVIALGKQICAPMDVRWAKHAIAYSSGGGETPNIDYIWDDNTKTYVQKSGYSEESVDSETGEEVTTTRIKTGDWAYNNASGLWFNNNYGFGIIDPDGFVEKVRDIAYTTVQTAYTATSTAITAGESEEKSGVWGTDFAVSVSGLGDDGQRHSLLNQNVETVSVTVNFSEAAIASTDFNLSSLKVILTDPNGYESVLVQESTDDPEVSVSALGLTSYTFLSNAFWGGAYTGTGEWKVRVEYDGQVSGGASVDMKNWVSVGAVDFRMGNVVNEGFLSVASEVNAHALVLDSESFTVAAGGKFLVEDAVYLNGGNFLVADGGTVGAYDDAKLKKGAVFVQNGGSATVAGTAVFARGIYVNGGVFNLDATVTAGAGTYVSGGTFIVKKNVDGVAVSAGDVTVRGNGSVVLESGANFGSSVTLEGGSLTAGSSSVGSNVVVLGGSANFAGGTLFASVSVGRNEVLKTETDEDGNPVTIVEVEKRGGQVVFNGKVTTSGISFSGDALGVVNEGSTLNTTSAAVSVAGDAVLNLVQRTAVTGDLSVSERGTAVWTGATSVKSVSVSGGALVADGDTVLTTTNGVKIASGGTFKVGKTELNGTLTVDAGATLEFDSRSRTDSDYLSLDGAASLTLAEPTEDSAVTTLKYRFGNAIPYEADVIRLEATGEVFSDETVAAAKAVNVELGEGTPKILVGQADGSFRQDNLKFVLKEVVKDEKASLVLTTTQAFDNLHLYYAGQTALQSAVQSTLLRNEAQAASFLKEFNAVEEVSVLLSTYEKLGVPSNVVAIDELHDKQANAITGAVSRRSRELRSGFIHYDVWSNPLLGSSGFSFSARPNLVAAKGFVPYMLEEADYPLMVWVNGGYSFSEADDGAMSVTSTKSNMLNVALGADYSINENLAAGVFIGYTSGRTKFDDGGRTEIQSRNIGVYLTGSRTDDLGSYYGTALASFGFEEYDFSRKFSLGSLNSSATASPDGWQGILFLEGGYEWKMEKFSTGPVASVRYVSNNIDGYTESSSDAWMRQEVDDVNYDSLQTSLGWRFAYRADFETVSLLPEARISWNHEFLGTDEDFDAKLAMAGADAYTCTIADTGDDYMSVGAGLTMMLGEVSTISLDYDMQFLRDDADPVHSVNAMFRTRF